MEIELYNGKNAVKTIGKAPNKVPGFPYIFSKEERI